MLNNCFKSLKKRKQHKSPHRWDPRHRHIDCIVDIANFHDINDDQVIDKKLLDTSPLTSTKILFMTLYLFLITVSSARRSIPIILYEPTIKLHSIFVFNSIYFDGSSPSPSSLSILVLYITSKIFAYCTLFISRFFGTLNFEQAVVDPSLHQYHYHHPAPTWLGNEFTHMSAFQTSCLNTCSHDKISMVLRVAGNVCVPFCYVIMQV